MSKAIKERNINVDIIRCVAVFSVLSVHFFLNNGFYNEVITGKRMYAMVLMRTIFMVCVPLFIMLTGYLTNKKQLNKSYFKGIVRTLLIYTVVSVVVLFFDKFYLKKDVYLVKGLLSTFGEYRGYSWYVEMYIGLFLLIPFLNVLYHSLESKEKKQYLILALLICTTLPSIVNCYDWFSSGFWIRPSSSQNYVNLIPKYWTGLWPLLFYFIGAYIREYDIKISLKKNLVLLIFSFLVFGTFNFYRNYGSVFLWEAYTEYGGVETVVNSVLVFLFILHLDLKKMHKNLKWIVVKISELSFGIYLVSYVADNIIYPEFNSFLTEVPRKLEWYIVVVPIVFLISAILSQIINWGCDIILKCISIIIRKKDVKK